MFNRHNQVILNKMDTKHKKLVQFIEYLFSGGAYFWIGYGVFALCWSVLDWSLWWAKLAANLTGWTVNYLLQRHWVFNNPQLQQHRTEVTGRYIFITAVDFILDYLIVAGLKGFGVSPYIGQFISAGFFTGWNYFWYRFWVFPNRLDERKFKVTIARILAHRPHGYGAFKVER